MVDLDVFDRALRHRREQRVRWVLNDRHATLSLDSRETGCAVVEISREHDTDHAWTERDSRAAEHRVDCRPIPVLLRTPDDMQSVAAEKQMVIGRSDVDATGDDRVA